MFFDVLILNDIQPIECPMLLLDIGIFHNAKRRRFDWYSNKIDFWMSEALEVALIMVQNELQ